MAQRTIPEEPNKKEDGTEAVLKSFWEKQKLFPFFFPPFFERALKSEKKKTETSASDLRIIDGENAVVRTQKKKKELKFSLKQKSEAHRDAFRFATVPLGVQKLLTSLL